MKSTKLALITGLAIASLGVTGLVTQFISAKLAGYVSREVVLKNGLTGNILGNAGEDVMRATAEVAKASTLFGIGLGAACGFLTPLLVGRKEEQGATTIYVDAVFPEEIEQFRAWRALHASRQPEYNQVDVVSHGNHRAD